MVEKIILVKQKIIYRAIYKDDLFYINFQLVGKYLEAMS